MAHGSMVTLLRRLQAKGWVTREKGPVGKAFIYEPTRGPSPTYRRIVHKLVRRIFGGNGVAMVSSLFATKPPTEGELERLQQLLEGLQAKTKRGKKK
jgi:predicted transcriptional regulator